MTILTILCQVQIRTLMVIYPNSGASITGTGSICCVAVFLSVLAMWYGNIDLSSPAGIEAGAMPHEAERLASRPPENSWFPSFNSLNLVLSQLRRAQAASVVSALFWACGWAPQAPHPRSLGQDGVGCHALLWPRNRPCTSVSLVGREFFLCSNLDFFFLMSLISSLSDHVIKICVYLLCLFVGVLIVSCLYL